MNLPPPPSIAGSHDNASFWALLALLRFFLASIVWSGHSLIAIGDPTSPYSVLGNMGVLAAVIGFFAISGFSIAHSISHTPHGFYARRLLRIYPVYLVCLFTICVLSFSSDARTVYSSAAYRPHGLPSILGNLLMLQTFTTHPILGPSWSLAIEAWMYLLAPMFLRARRELLFGLAILSAFAYLCANGLGWNEFVWPNDHGLKVCLFAWAWLSGFLYYLENGSLRATLLLLLGVPMVALYNQPVWAPVTMALVFTTLHIVPKIMRPHFSKYPWALFDYLGEISYPLYLCHVCVFVALRGIFHMTDGATQLCVSLLAAMALFHFADQPARKFFKARAQLQGTALTKGN